VILVGCVIVLFRFLPEIFVGAAALETLSAKLECEIGGVGPRVQAKAFTSMSGLDLYQGETSQTLRSCLAVSTPLHY
jgi:hypothetical protein